MDGLLPYLRSHTNVEAAVVAVITEECPDGCSTVGHSNVHTSTDKPLIATHTEQGLPRQRLCGFLRGRFRHQATPAFGLSINTKTHHVPRLHLLLPSSSSCTVLPSPSQTNNISDSHYLRVRIKVIIQNRSLLSRYPLTPYIAGTFCYDLSRRRGCFNLRWSTPYR